MAQVFPPNPTFANLTEREVWEKLIHLPDDHVVLANLRVVDEHQDHEADFVVLVPDGGIVTLEVKGGSISVDDDGQWWQSGGRGTHRIDPVEQVIRTKHAVRSYLQQHPRWSRGRVRWQHAIVMPYTQFPDDFSQPGCPRALVLGADEQAQLGRHVQEIAVNHETNFPPLDADDVALAAEILVGRYPMTQSIVEQSEERESHADRLTQEQALLLRATRLLKRVEVRGGAGSGKTVLAVTQAKELTRGLGDVPPMRVALVCYSIGLGEWFKRSIDAVRRKEQPAFYGRFEELGRSWGVDTNANRNQSDFWEHELPAKMAAAARELPDGKKFDAIIVDEAQDFAEEWWTPLLLALRDPEEGRVYVYSDENQALFPRFGRPPIQLIPLVLDHNLRNTKQIAESFASLAPMRMRALGGDGVDVEFIQASGPDEIIRAADDQVERLWDEGWEPKHIALITTGTRHPVQKELQAAHGEEGYWSTFWDNEDVFYGHVLGCKGLERRAVVLAVNESGGKDRAKERLYVGLSRATDRLIVVGDGATIREMGGDELANQLGIDLPTY